MPRRPLTPLVAAACAGAAAWCSIGALGIGADGSLAARLGLLPPWWLLPSLVAAAVAVAWMTRLTSGASLPLFASGLLIVPWLPGPIPAAALTWTGPVTVIVWLAVAAGMISEPRVRLRAEWLVNPRRAPRVAAAIAFGLFTASAWWLADLLPSGDEPHYLVITQSLLRDHDLQIENNHTRSDYLAYFRGQLKPDYLRRGKNGQIYSIHAPGISALVAPAFAWFGYPGVVVFLSLVAGAGTGLLWRSSYLLTLSASAAWFGWACGALTAPFFLHTFQVYPDGVAATIVLAAAMPLVELSVRSVPAAESDSSDGGEGTRWLLTGAALASLPWLHTRFAVISCVLGACLVMRIAGATRPFRRVFLFASVPLVSAAAWFGYFYVIYGSFNPSAPYARATQTTPANIASGLPALLFSQQFGILPNAPVYALCAAGLFVLARRHRRLAIELAVVTASYLLSASMFYMWWAGRSAPARFGVPILLTMAIPGACLWQYARLKATRAVAVAALVQSAAITAVLIVPQHGRLAFNDRDGFTLWLDWFNQLVDLPRGMPSFFRQTTGGALARAGIWGLACIAAWLALRWIERRRRDITRGALALATSLSLATAIMVALTSVWALERVQGVTPNSSQLDLVRHYDTSLRPVGLDFGTARSADAANILSQLRLSTSRRRPLPPDPPLLLATEVPAGRYRVHVRQGSASAGTATLFIGRAEGRLWTWNLRDGLPEGTADFDLPVDVGSVLISGDAEAKGAAVQLELQPLNVVASGDEIAGGLARRATRYGTATVYFLDDEAYMEPTGFWIAGSANARVVVAPGGRRETLRLFVRNAPVPNRLVIEASAHKEEIELQPREEQTIDVPQGSGGGALLMHFRAEHGFTPALVDPGSTDFRFLGCWIEVRNQP